MKKIFVFLLVLIMAFSVFSACGKGNYTDSNPNSDSGTDGVIDDGSDGSSDGSSDGGSGYVIVDPITDGGTYNK